MLKIVALGIYQGSNMQFGNSPSSSKALRYTAIRYTELVDTRFEWTPHILRNLIHRVPADFSGVDFTTAHFQKKQKNIWLLRFSLQ